ncbi:translocation/assembly module TamB domain-containing protein [Rhizobium sp. SGZ-381]|uniref:translocation/assembly module TamB domain-containing protein n=1 Tax=Rhizobium sp. SGZ-381 TaxID=3342800 RepID=UPI00366B0F8A
MTSSSRKTAGIARAVLLLAALLLVAALGFVMFLGFVPAGNRLAGQFASSLLSSPGQTISMSPPRGLLTGRLRIDNLTVSDVKGVYAQAHDIDVDWSPLSLLKRTFHARTIAIAGVEVSRPPVPVKAPRQQTRQNSGSGFSLPVAIDIDRISLPDIILAPAVTGRSFQIAAEGSANATGERVALKLSANRKDAPNALAKADLVFAPGQNELKLQALVAEPQGGLLARLLHLPGAPSLALALDGQGPLSSWSGQLRGTVNGQPVISMDGRHTLTAEGRHQLQISGGGQLAQLLPPTLRPLFAGRTDINVGAMISPNGRIEISKSELTTGAMRVAASGALDPSGDNSLMGSATAINGAVAMEWPLEDEPLRFALDNLNFTLTGPAESSRFNATAALKSISTADARFGQVRVQAESEDLNLRQWAGSVRTRLSAAEANFTDPDLDRLIDGPIRLDAPIRLALPAIGLDASTFESGNISGTISGAYNLSQQSVTGNVRMSLNPDGLPEVAGQYLDGMVGVEGYIDAVIGGRMSLENLVVKSSLLEGHGNILLKDGKLEAHLAGRAPDLSKLRPDAKGAAGYDVVLSGPIEALGAKAAINAAEARFSGHLFEGISLAFQGVVTGKEPNGALQATGRVDGKPINLKTQLRQKDDLVSLGDMLLEAGSNRVSGSLTFSRDYLPAGRLEFALPDVGLLTAFAGQPASGDLSGTLDLSNSNGVLAAKLDASGQSVTAQGVMLEKPVLALSSSNVKTLAADGTLRAARVALGAQAISDAVVTLKQDGALTGLDLAASYAGAPLALAARVDRSDSNAVLVAMDRFSAAPGGVDLHLKEPAPLRIAGGRTEIGSVKLAVGAGTVLVDGSAGQQLNIAVRASDLPAQLANGFVEGLGASGRMGGAATVSGTAASPIVRYSVNWEEAELAETRARSIAPLSISARGQFQNGTVTIDHAGLEGQDGLDVSVNGTIAVNEPRRIVMQADIASLPAALANSLRPQLAAKGTVKGSGRVTGTISEPVADFNLSLGGASTAETRSAGLSDLAGQMNGHFEQRLLSISDLSISGPHGLSVTAAGTLGLDGDRPVTLRSTLTNVPAGLVNAVRPDLQAEGTLSGTLAAGGTLAAPQADFDLQLSGASAEATREARVGPLAVSARGRYADQLLTLTEARLSGENGLSAAANGTVGLGSDGALALSAQFAALPAALANLARPGLAASGTASGTISASGTLAAPVATYDVTVADIATTQSRSAGVKALDLRALGRYENGVLTLEQTQLSDPSGLSLTASGRVILTGPQAPALDLNADIRALPANLANAFVPGLDAGGVISGTVASTGSPQAPATRFDLKWQDAQTRQTRNAALAGLEVAARGTFANNILTLQQAGLTGPSGLAVSASGTVGLSGDKALDVSATIASLPASLISGFVPDVDAGGTLSGTAALSGTVAAPAVKYDLQWADGVIRRQGDAGISNLTLKAAGSFEGGRLTLGTTRLTGPQGLSISASGTVTTNENAPPILNLNADIAAVPARLANAFVPGLGAAGTVSGKVSALPGGGANGARFDLTWADAALAQTTSAGVPPFRITANGTFENNRVAFETQLGGASGLSLRGSGSIGLTGNRPLDLRVDGTVPFALLAAQLSSQGLVLEGNANVNVAVGGTAAAPSVTGKASTSAARLVDVTRNLAVNGIAGSVEFNRDRAVISRLSGTLSPGGTVTVNGSVGLNEGFAADLDIALANATYVDGNLVTATVNGALNLSGPLLQGPKLSGNVTLLKADITVPASLPSSLAELNVKHRNAPADVRALLASLQPKEGSKTSAGIALDLTMTARNSIFVRGRGIDAELGGSLTIRGSSAEPVVTGGFEMRRGRIIILTKRLDFSTGKITFGGSLVPVLDLVASTASDQTTINITVTGPANNPDIGFGSSPSLPQDEVLARLIFGQSMSRLSALQIAQLADAVTQLAGGGSNSLLQTLRSGLGVDDLDINTDESGQTSVSVGRYINNRTYFQLEQGGSSGGAKASINLDVGRGVKLKGSAGSEGGSAGVFYEREY